jgi:hypothetical protein
VELLSAAEIAEDRRMAEDNLPDTCRITRGAAGRGAFNETTGQYANDGAAGDVIYEGPCKIQVRADINNNIVEPVEAEREWGYETSTLVVPISPVAGCVGDPGKVFPDDVCTMLNSSYDPALPGRVFNVHTSFHKSIASTRRFKIREPVR